MWLKFRDTTKGFAKEMTRARTLESEGASCVTVWKKTFLAEGTAGAKALRWEGA